MRRFIPSPAMTVALLALAVALSGTAVAARQALAPPNTVGTQALVNGSIRLVDIAPATVRLLKGQTGPQGAQGLQGQPGVQGVPGAAGANGGFDPAKVQVVVGSQAIVPASAIGSTTAQCPGGTTLIGGGAFTNAAALWVSRPAGSAWFAGASGYSSLSGVVQAYAICAAP